jgi:ureidoacrylate peracid hydrolase
MTDFPVVPSKIALVNVDMQNCFVENSPIAAPGGLKVLGRINRLIETCRANGVQIIHTAHVVRDDGSNIGVMGEIIPPVNDGVINKSAPSAALHDDLDVRDGDIVLDKPRFGSFHGTDLELILRAKGIDTIIVTGIATNVCCETTAREANVRDFRVFFLSDGTATFGIGDFSADDIQAASCATLGFFFAQVVTVDEMIAKIAASGGVAAAAE